MPVFDLSGDLRKSLTDALVRAKTHYEAGEDEKAAQAYEAASRLSLKLAEYAPDRKAELARKADAVKYRDYARRLAAGEVAAAGGGPGEGDGKGPSPRPSPAGRGSAAAGVPEKPVRGGGGGSGSASEDGAELSTAVSNLVTTSPVTWDQIGGLDETKREIKYALALSIARAPAGVEIATWRNVLFYGPPGTGKTLLAAATSNALKLKDQGDERKAVFFNVKVSSVLSKYFGESSKIISELYGTARDASPSVIFLDEFEALAGQRDSNDPGPERRILSTILSELDGLAEKGRSDIYVLTIAATNRPWDLDPAILSRFEKKVLIPLPDATTRRAILEIHLRKKGYGLAADTSYDDLVAMTDGYSGREIERFVKEVTHRMIAEMNETLPGLVDRGLDEVRSYQVRVRELKRKEFETARSKIHPQTTSEEMTRYVNWRESAEA